MISEEEGIGEAYQMCRNLNCNVLLCCLQLFGFWTKSCQTSNSRSFEYGRYVQMTEHLRFLKRWVGLVLCQQPISCVFTSVFHTCFPAIDLSKNSLPLFKKSVLCGRCFSIFPFSANVQIPGLHLWTHKYPRDTASHKCTALPAST